MWSQRGNSGDGGNWNPGQPPSSFSGGPPSLLSLPVRPQFTGGSSGGGRGAWSSAGGPHPRFGGPPPSFSGPPCRGRLPSPGPPFPGPPRPQFSGPPPSFGNNQPSQSAAPGPWNSYPGSCPPGDRCKRPVNNVWSDPGFFASRTGFENRNGHPYHHNRGRGGGGGGGRGRGGGGRGRGRGGQHFQQGGNKIGNTDNRNNNAGNNNNNSGGKKKKKKIDKRNLLENNQYHCEVCDRGFRTEEKYQEHVSQHTKCSVAGCPYVAAPKLVQFHYYTQHQTGMAKKIWSLDSPESIKKWLEDRKRNYPTKANIERKEKERAERRARGEMIENKQFGKMRGQGRGGRGHHRGGRGRNWGGGGRGCQGELDDNKEELSQQQTPASPEHQPQNEESSPLRTDRVNGKGGHSQEDAASEGPEAKKRKLDKDEEGDALKSKVGDSGHVDSGSGSDSDSDSDSESDSGSDSDSDSGSEDSSSEEESETPENASPTKSTGNGLSSLLAAYHSAEDKEESTDKEDKEEEEETTTEVEAEAPSDSTATKETNGMSNEKPSDDNPRAASKVRARKEEPAWIRLNKRARYQQHKRNTLLEKLLASEIRHERNVLLQCVHYIVKTNFLGILDRKTDAVGK